MVRVGIPWSVHCPLWLQIILLTALYFLAAKFGLQFGAVGGIATPVWPPTGLAMAALLVYGVRLWPGIALAAFLINFSATHQVLPSLGIGVGNTLEAVVAAYILRRLEFRNSLARVRDVLLLIGVAGVGCTLISAVIGVTSSWMSGVIPGSSLGRALSAWWVGDAMGCLVFTPVLLAWHEKQTIEFSIKRTVECLALTISVVGISLLIFSPISSEETKFFLRIHHLFPFLVWATVRFGQRTVTSMILIVSAIAVAGTSANSGPFHQWSLTDSLIALQLFIAVLVPLVLILRALVVENHSVHGALLKTSQERQDLVGIVSHDLKNPLSLILLASQMSLRDMEREGKKAEVIHQLEIIRRSGILMNRLLEDLLDLNKIEKGLFLMDLQPHKISDVIEGAAEFLKPLAHEKGLILQVDTKLRSNQFVCDRERIIQVLSNLVGNAIKFTPAGGSDSIEVNEEPTEVHFKVKDTGPGISAEHMSRIFDRYWQLKKTQRDGSGLGLSIAKGIVVAHHGRIWVESQLGDGSAFHFVLPIS
jgi:signal transduction histidine kinase